MKMKRFFSILLTLMLVLGLLPGMSVMAIADGQHHIYNEISAIISGLSITKNGTTVTDASSGDTITLTISGQPVTGEIGTLFQKTDRVIASRNIMVDGLQAYKADGTTITTNPQGSQTWSFTMPDGDVYVAFPPLTKDERISINAGEAVFRTGFATLNSYCFYTHKTTSDGDSFGYLAYKDSTGKYNYTSNDDKGGSLNFRIPSDSTLTIMGSTFYHLGFTEFHDNRSGTFTIPAFSSNNEMDIPFGSQSVSPQTVTAKDIEMSFGEICTIAATTDGNGTLSYKVESGNDVIDVNYLTGVITTKKTGTARVKITASGTTTYAVGSKSINVTVNKARAIVATVNENSRTYDGTEKPLVTVDNSTLVGGTMKYALGTDGITKPTEGWSDTIPTGKDAGTYYVWYKAVGDTDHIDSNAECVPVEILELVSLTVTYKVVNGTWSDGTTTDITETVQSGLKPVSVPTGMKASEGYTGGAWNTNPADATITEATTFTYTFDANVVYTVTSVENWEHTIDYPNDIIITVKRNTADNITYSMYTGASVDGNGIPAGGSSVAQGSLILTLKGSYLDTLSTGTHKVTISFKDGSADATISIVNAPPAPTAAPT